MTDDEVRMIASLIDENIDWGGEYENLEDIDEFSESDSSWSGGERNNRWAFEAYPCPINVGAQALVDAKVEYQTDYHKGYRGDYYSPPEPAWLEVHSPETTWFRIWDATTGDFLAYWRKHRNHLERRLAGGDWESVPAGIDPANTIQITDEQVKEIKEHFEDLWEEMRDRVQEYENENPPDPPDPPEPPNW